MAQTNADLTSNRESSTGSRSTTAAPAKSADASEAADLNPLSGAGSYLASGMRSR
jgi:hypothetical protein